MRSRAHIARDRFTRETPGDAHAGLRIRYQERVGIAAESDADSREMSARLFEVRDLEGDRVVGVERRVVPPVLVRRGALVGDPELEHRIAELHICALRASDVIAIAVDDLASEAV